MRHDWVRAIGGPACVAAALIASALVWPRLPANTALADVLFVWAGLHVGIELVRRRTLCPPGARALVLTAYPWLLLIALGTALSMIDAGAPRWLISAVVRDVFIVVVALVVVIAAEWLDLDRRALIGTTAAAIGACAVVPWLWSPGADSARSTGTFFNPNMAGSYYVLGALILTVAMRRDTRLWCVPAACLAFAATALTGSFAAASMTLAFLAVVVLDGLRRTAHRPRWPVVAAVGAALLTLAGILVSDTGRERLSRSPEGRVALYTDQLGLLAESPLGIGPTGLANRAGVDLAPSGSGLVGSARVSAHSDVVGFLVERSILGLIGLVGLVVALFRAAVPGGLLRPSIAAMGAAALTHEVAHFRHFVVFFALAWALDRAHARSPLRGRPLTIESPTPNR